MFKRHALSSARGVRGTAIALPPPTSRPALTRRPRPWVRTPRFTVAEGVNGQNLVKTSVQRGIRAKLAEQFPTLEEGGALEELLPKKDKLVVAKSANHVNLVVANNQVLFFNIRDGPYFPTLRVLHKYPHIMPRLRVDKGAIKFVFGGANIMCPGLTSAGATIHDEVDADTPVAIYAEGKEHALAVGLTKMSTADMRSINKGHGVETLHNINDGLWKDYTLVM